MYRKLLRYKIFRMAHDHLEIVRKRSAKDVYYYKSEWYFLCSWTF